MKEKNQDIPHVMTTHERGLIEKLTPVIKDKQLVRFWYNDATSDFEGWRLVEPHLIGQTKYKTANILLLGWFLPTQEQLYVGHEAKWGNYIMEGISKLEILDQKYTRSRQGYNPQDKRMTKIFCATQST
jgi:hypothetical protein